MFVGRNRFAKRHIPQILQCVRQGIILRIAGFPQAVTFREFIWRKGGQPQQVVRPIFDHVDRKVISRVDAEFRTVPVAKRQPLEVGDD